MDNISDILSSLSEEDINNLKQTAASIFSKENTTPPSENTGSEKLIPGGFDAELIGKIGSLMNSMKNDDKRCTLIEALRPYLSKERQRRCDEALKILRLISVLPLIREQKII